MTQEIFNKIQLSSAYKKYRPSYNDDIARYVISYMRESTSNKEDEKFDFMVEVGCGSGQATQVFAPYFNKVLATDLSPAQVRHAVAGNMFDHVTYQVGSAEEMEFENASADLVLSAESVHFFDLPRFLSEAKRVLKPGGCLAIMGYFDKSICRLDGDYPATDAKPLIYGTMKKFAPKSTVKIIDIVRNRYASVFEAIPWPDKRRCDDFSISCEWTLQDFQGFEESLGWFQDYLRRNGGKFEHERLKGKVMRQFGIENEDEEVRFRCTFDVFVILSRV